MKKTNIVLISLNIVILITTILVLVLVPESHETGSHNYSSSNNSLNKSNLSITNVKIEHNSVFTVCTGTISVSPYSQYKYHNIKVKGAFKTSYGKTVDTDWTYAIGTEWLEPGESSKFRLSVDKDTSIATCEVTIMN